MRALGFYQSQYDTALFLDRKNTYVAIYVNDLQIIGPSLKVIEELKTCMAQSFKMTDPGSTSHYLGMEIHMSEGAVTITQKTYIEKILQSHQMSNCNPSLTPMIEGLGLQPAPLDFIPDPADVTAYIWFTGSVEWLACQTRPDIIQTVAKLSKHNVKPTEECWKAVVHLLTYLKGTKSRGIRYANGDLIPFGYSDSSWVDDLFNQKLTAGYLFILNGGPISLASRKRPTVSTFTCEAEYIAQTEAAFEAVWICGLLRELGIMKTVKEDCFLKTVAPPTLIFADNQGTIKLTSNPEYHRKTKLIPIKYHKSIELVKDGSILFEWVPTQEIGWTHKTTCRNQVSRFCTNDGHGRHIDFFSFHPWLVQEGSLELRTIHSIPLRASSTYHVSFPFHSGNRAPHFQYSCVASNILPVLTSSAPSIKRHIYSFMYLSHLAPTFMFLTILAPSIESII